MRIICILGRSASGKSAIESRLASLGYNKIITYTSRKPRGKEQNGKEYHFVSEEDFKRLIDKGILMEYSIYNGNYYGSPRPIGSINNVIVVDTEGYLKIKELYGKQAIGVYVDTPNDVIHDRVKLRGDTSEEDMHKRELEDDRIFKGVKDKVDLILDGTQPVDISVIKILNFVREKNVNGR